ncbi:peptidoglycan DD-metalloendopeptidase family protein [Escherichia coli]|uniref:peptidoglycan DD-metalloendopeptidase family protein n=1 Tax=Escherichia coli TaxID=562 RepID=UPI0032E86B1F
MSLVSLWLAGCSDTSNPPAPVSSVNGNAPANTNSGMLITPPPKMGTTSTAQQPQIQPVQQPQIQATQQPQIQPVQPVAQQPVQMENGRIVYNRQYGNIPKGSYSGSTYTVKKGDTLFYIAWITGNDFRDLAQRNNIQAPYALNVGQTLQVGDDYLSAYAHNDTMLVREQQEVKAGQKIATMGSTGTSSTRLHFEIRYKGKSVNPLRYLPQR